MGWNIHLFSSAWPFFVQKFKEEFLCTSQFRLLDHHLDERKIVDLTVLVDNLKRYIISSCKLYLLECLDYHSYNYTI